MSSSDSSVSWRRMAYSAARSLDQTGPRYRAGISAWASLVCRARRQNSSAVITPNPHFHFITQVMQGTSFFFLSTRMTPTLYSSQATRYARRGLSLFDN